MGGPGVQPRTVPLQCGWPRAFHEWEISLMELVGALCTAVERALSAFFNLGRQL